jgi:hypothetical protein
MKSQELSKICFPPRAYSGFKCLKTSQHINIQKGRIQITYNSQTKKRTETRVGEYCFRSHLHYPIVSSLLQVKKNPHIQFYWKPHFIAFHAWIKRSEKHFHMISYTSRQEPLNWNLHHLRNFSSRITKDLCSPSTPIHTMPHSFRQNCQPTACTDYNEIEKLSTNPGAIKQCHYCQLVSTRNPFQYINSMTFSIVSYFTCLHS